MRKKVVIILLVAIITQCLSISGVLVFFLAFSNNTGNASVTNVVVDSKIEDTKNQDIVAEVSLEKYLVQVHETLNLKSSSDRIYINVSSKNLSETTISEIVASSKVTGTVWHGSTLEIQTEQPCDQVVIDYEFNLKANNKITSLHENKILLTNFLITPAVYKGEEPVFIYPSEFGDPYIYETNSYSVSIKADKSYAVYAAGKTDERFAGTRRINLFEVENFRDFSVVLVNSAKVQSEKIGDTTVYFLDSQKTIEHVKKAFLFAEKNIGAYAYKEFFVVQTPLELKGMEFSGMIFLSEKIFDSKDKSELERVTHHEVLHQWFYGIIGTDQLNEPYFDEGIVNYLSIVLSDGYISGSSSERFKRYTLKDYDNKPEYMSVAYTGTSKYLRNVHRSMGDKFYSALGMLYQQKKFSIACFSDFEKCIQYYGGGN